MGKEKKLIICPSCMSNRKKVVLGEIVGGNLEVKRFHKGITGVRGKEFEVVCGECGEIAYFKSEVSN